MDTGLQDPITSSLGERPLQDRDRHPIPLVMQQEPSQEQQRPRTVRAARHVPRHRLKATPGARCIPSPEQILRRGQTTLQPGRRQLGWGAGDRQLSQLRRGAGRAAGGRRLRRSGQCDGRFFVRSVSGECLMPGSISSAFSAIMLSFRCAFLRRSGAAPE